MEDPREELGAKRAKGNYVGSGKKMVRGGGGKSLTVDFSRLPQRARAVLSAPTVYPSLRPSSSFFVPLCSTGAATTLEPSWLFIPLSSSRFSLRNASTFFCSSVPESRCRLKNPLFFGPCTYKWETVVLLLGAPLPPFLSLMGGARAQRGVPFLFCLKCAAGFDNSWDRTSALEQMQMPPSKNLADSPAAF